MPKSADLIVDEMNDALRKRSGYCLTIPWSDFYELAERQRLKEAFLDRVRTRALDRRQLVVAYGWNVVVVSHDSDFAPAETVSDSSG